MLCLLIANLPIIISQVSANEMFAEGTGSSKQLAKHNAAQKLLEFLQFEEKNKSLLSQALNTVSSPEENQLNFNAVGSLMDYCTTKNHPLPIYYLVRDEGPAHAKIFTYKCAVSNVSELGTARTKKQAKHKAAYAMLTKLKTLYKEEVNPVALKSELKQAAAKKEEDINQLYFGLSKTQRVPGTDSAFIINQYRAYSRLVERSQTLMKIVLGEPWNDKPLETFKSVAEDLGVEPVLKELESASGEVYVVGMNISPLLYRSGDCYYEAAKLAMESMLSFL